MNRAIPVLLQRRPFMGGGFAQLRGWIRSLAPAAWFQYGVGITSATALVSNWADQSGNGRDLKQTTDTNKPTLQADNSILFDGVDNFMKCDAFTLNQPCTLYALFKQITWASNDTIFDSNTALDISHGYQATSSPTIAQFSTGPGNGATTNAVALDTYVAYASVANEASSLIQVNNGTASTGSIQAGAVMGGFVLGARSTGANASNIQVKEVIVFAAAHNAATRARVIRYLGIVGGLGL